MNFDSEKHSFIESNLKVIKDSENTLKEYYSKDAFERMSQAIDNIKDAFMIEWYESDIAKMKGKMTKTITNIDFNEDIIEDDDVDDKMKEFIIKYKEYKELKQRYNIAKSDALKKMKMIECAKNLSRMYESILSDISNSASCEEEFQIWKKYMNL